MGVFLYDSTIRDGKPMNCLDGGSEIISNLASELSGAGVEYVDVGYLSELNFSSDFAFYNSIDRAENLLPRDTNTNWIISIRMGRNELNLIPECRGLIKAIRFTVPYNDTASLKEYASFIKEKGFDVICEIDNTFGYKDMDLIGMITAANEAGISQFEISNRSGKSDENDLQRIYYLLDNNLNKEIKIGARFSDAYKSAYQMARKLVELSRDDNREIVISGSLFGIGDHQGNLIIEMMADYLNDYCSAKYNLDCMYRLIGKYIQPIVKNQFWGYHPAYYMAGKCKVDSDYAQYMLDRDVPLEKIGNVLKKIAETEEYKEFDESIAEKAFQNI